MDYDVKNEKFIGVEGYYFNPYLLLKLLYRDVHEMVVANGIHLYDDETPSEAQKSYAQPRPNQKCKQESVENCTQESPQEELQGTYQETYNEADNGNHKSPEMQDFAEGKIETSPLSETIEDSNSPGVVKNESTSDESVSSNTDMKALWAVVNSANESLQRT